MTTAAAPYFLTILACSINLASPSFIEIELTIHLPCTHFKPASMTLNFDESIIIGSFAISGSDMTRCKNSTIAFSESNKPSSIFTSIICAPPSTCERATSKAAVKSPCLINRAKARLPVTFVRSPTLIKLVFSRTIKGSSPE